MGTITTLGSPSKTTFLAREADRLALEFIAGTGADLKPGQPVKLHTDGTVVAWAAADTHAKLLGYCYQAAVAGEYVTVFTRGYIVLLVMADTGGVSAGPANYSGYDTSTTEVVLGSGNTATTGYNKYANTSDGNIANSNAFLLEAGSAGDVVRALLRN